MSSNEVNFEVVLKSMGGSDVDFQKLQTTFRHTVHSEIREKLGKNDFYKILYTSADDAVLEIAAEVWHVVLSGIQRRRLVFKSLKEFQNYLGIVCRHRTYRFMSKRIRNRTKKSEQINHRHENSDDTNLDFLIRDSRVHAVGSQNIRFESIEALGSIETISRQSPEQEIVEEQLSQTILDKLTEKERQVIELI
ncbi:hypothetical protein CGH56_23320, partial [Vibrio parahaemolyticus]